MSKPDCLPCATLAYTELTFDFQGGEQTMEQRQQTYDDHILYGLSDQLNDTLFDNCLHKSKERWLEGSNSHAVLLHSDWIPHVVPGKGGESDDDDLIRLVVGFRHHPVKDFCHYIWVVVEDYDGEILLDVPAHVLQKKFPAIFKFDQVTNIL